MSSAHFFMLVDMGVSATSQLIAGEDYTNGEISDV